jgi:hypothetical protein
MYLRSDSAEWMKAWRQSLGAEVAVAAVIWVSLKSTAHFYTHVRTSIRQGPEKTMKQTGRGIEPVRSRF